MPKVTVYNQTGSQVGEIELAEAIFGIEPNEAVLFEAVMMQRASLRQGTHKVKTRSEVRGGGRKPWRQKELDVLVKGLSALLNGVVVVRYSDLHQDYAYKLPKKVRRLAIKSALATKVVENNIVVLEDLVLNAPKQKIC